MIVFDRYYVDYDLRKMIDDQESYFVSRTKTNTKFETHHIIYRSEKPNHEHLHSSNNLILLCVLCHNYFHKSKQTRVELVKERKLNEMFGNDVWRK